MLLNFFSQETILSVRLHLINTKRCRQQPEPGPFFPLFSARWFAYENRFYWLCGQACANRAGSSSAPGRLSRFSRPGGLRTKTEFIGFAGRRTQTDLRTCRCLCWRHKTKRAAADNFSAAALLLFKNPNKQYPPVRTESVWMPGCRSCFAHPESDSLPPCPWTATCGTAPEAQRR